MCVWNCFECLDALLPTLTIVVNHSLWLTGEFPLSFKTAIVKLLLQKTSLDSEDLKNYRPIFNLSFMSKVLEKIVLSQILQHINCNKLLSDFQSAYRPHYSTETALFESDRWFTLCNGWWLDLGACASGSICNIWHYWLWNFTLSS